MIKIIKVNCHSILIKAKLVIIFINLNSSKYKLIRIFINLLIRIIIFILNEKNNKKYILLQII